MAKKVSLEKIWQDIQVQEQRYETRLNQLTAEHNDTIKRAERAETERDDLRRQLAEADQGLEQTIEERDRREQQIYNIVRELGSDAEWTNLCDLGAHATELAAVMFARVEKAEADNAALVEYIGSAPMKHLHNCYFRGSNGVAMLGECHPRCEEKRRLAILSQPNPGAPILSRMADLERENEGLKTISNLLPPTLPAPMPNLPPAWAEDQRLLYKAVTTARDAIRNRKEPSDA